MARDGDEKGDEGLYVAVGARIRELREAAGMTQESFATATGMNPDYVWRIEAGRQNLSLKTLGRAALALDRPLTALFEGIVPDASVMEPRKGTAAEAKPEQSAATAPRAPRRAKRP